MEQRGQQTEWLNRRRLCCPWTGSFTDSKRSKIQNGSTGTNGFVSLSRGSRANCRSSRRSFQVYLALQWESASLSSRRRNMKRESIWKSQMNVINRTCLQGGYFEDYGEMMIEPGLRIYSFPPQHLEYGPSRAP